MQGITIRTALPRDKEQVLAFCQQTFEWGDYIGEAWDIWLADPQGRLLVAVRDHSEPVALSRAALASPEEAWFEGMRVDPRYRRTGIASLMMQECLQIVRELGAKVVRFATASSNTIVHHVAASTGFARVGVFMAWAAEAAEGDGADPGRIPKEQPHVPDTGWSLPRAATRGRHDQNGLILDTLYSPAEAWDFIQGSALYRESGGLFSTGWTFHRLTMDKIEKRLKDGEVLGIRKEGRLLSLAIVGEGRPREGLTADYITGETREIGRMARALRSLAARRSLPRVTARLPDSPDLKEALTGAGYAPLTQDALWIFEMQL